MLSVKRVSSSFGVLMGGLGLCCLSSLCSAEYSVTKIEKLTCRIKGKGAAEVVLPAIPKARHSAKSLGIEEQGVTGSLPNGLIKVVGDNKYYAEMTEGSKQEVAISAVCWGKGNSSHDLISTTGSQKACYKGERLVLVLDDPLHPTDPRHYVAHVEVTTTYDGTANYDGALRQQAAESRREIERLDGEISRDLRSFKPGLAADLSSICGEIRQNTNAGKRRPIGIDTSFWSIDHNYGKLINSELGKAITVSNH